MFLTLVPQIRSLRAQSLGIASLSPDQKRHQIYLTKYLFDQIFGLTLARSHLQWELLQVQLETSGQGVPSRCAREYLGGTFQERQTKRLHYNLTTGQRVMCWGGSWDFCGFSEDKLWPALVFFSNVLDVLSICTHRLPTKVVYSPSMSHWTSIAAHAGGVLVDRPTQLICISDIYLLTCWYVNRQIQKT